MGVLSLPDGAEDHGRVGDYAPVADRVRPEDFEQVEDYLRAYLADVRFRSAYLPACERFSDASCLLYSAGSKDRVLLAGERARETLEEFVRAFVGPQEGPASNGLSSAARTVGLAAVISSCRPRVGDARCEFLQGLFDYWRVLLDVVERPGHDEHEAGTPVRWEDARRVVVLTALVMVEIDRSL